ncbi:MAG: nucleotidyl transferase AbiEii/AbiGii toxin family protein [Gammaproteobacteria bacterium]
MGILSGAPAKIPAQDFQPQALAKTKLQMRLIRAVHHDAFLKMRIALYGASAINYFLLDTPRVSGDIDFLCIGMKDPQGDEVERIMVVRALARLLEEAGLEIIKPFTERNLRSSWILAYHCDGGMKVTFNVDLSFRRPVPLWGAAGRADSNIVAGARATCLLLSPLEIIASKITTMFYRCAVTDLFDCSSLFAEMDKFNADDLRLGVVFLSCLYPGDLRKARPENISCDAVAVREKLLPLMVKGGPEFGVDAPALGDFLVRRCRQLASRILPLESGEFDFLDSFYGGQPAPKLLTSDPALQDRMGKLLALVFPGDFALSLL